MQVQVTVKFIDIPDADQVLAVLVPATAKISGIEFASEQDYNMMRSVHDISNRSRKITVFASKEAAEAAAQVEDDNGFFTAISRIEEDIWAVNGVSRYDYDSGLPAISDKRDAASLEFAAWAKAFCENLYEHEYNAPLHLDFDEPATEMTM